MSNAHFRDLLTAHCSSLFAAHLSGGFEDAFFRRDRYIFQRRRERNRNVHCSHTFYRRIEIVERALGNDRREFGRDSISAVAFIEHNHS